jgi:hypothetical protein
MPVYETERIDISEAVREGVLAGLMIITENHPWRSFVHNCQMPEPCACVPLKEEHDRLLEIKLLMNGTVYEQNEAMRLLTKNGNLKLGGPVMSNECSCGDKCGCGKK